jgi:hypothetical protein
MARSLEEDIRMVIMQFAFTNESLVPEGISRKAEESPEHFVARGQAVRGEQILEPVEKVSAVRFIGDLVEAGYVLVDAFWRQMQKVGRPFFTVRFVFVQEDHANSSEDFLHKRPKVIEALTSLTTEAMWRTRAFLNPFFLQGDMIEGVYSISVNLEARVPMFDKDGNPLLVWLKDKRGEKIGDQPVPIEPQLFLRIENGDIVVADA